VSVLREWTQVKDRREEESSEGKRMGEMGQLRKEREWREERDLRAVKERATSFGEQLARERERRWRKGFEESQTRVALLLLWQGSFEVGMLRDCSALSCFGSSVEGEEEEEKKERRGTASLESEKALLELKKERAPLESETASLELEEGAVGVGDGFVGVGEGFVGVGDGFVGVGEEVGEGVGVRVTVLLVVVAAVERRRRTVKKNGVGSGGGAIFLRGVQAAVLWSELSSSGAWETVGEGI
jgi:hypothetical protein